VRRAAKYLLIMVVPLAVLLVRPLTSALVLLRGEEVRLEIEPFDPRDIFRGDYVDLRFAIEEVPMSLMDPRSGEENSEDDGASIYVTLAPDDRGVYRPLRLTKTEPSKGVCIRGRVSRYRSLLEDEDTVVIDYGENLRRFYVKENTGLELEEAARRGKVEAIAKVWNSRIILDRIEIISAK